MGLRGRLSNPSETHRTLLNDVSEGHFKFSWMPILAKSGNHGAEGSGRADGRRQFGEVSGAVKAVLGQADGAMRMKDVHAAVQVAP